MVAYERWLRGPPRVNLEDFSYVSFTDVPPRLPMAHVHDTVVEGTMKLLMWKESAAIVAVRHLSTGVSNTGNLHYCVEITSNQRRKFEKCSQVQIINWNCFSFNLSGKLHCSLPRILLLLLLCFQLVPLFFADFQMNSCVYVRNLHFLPQVSSSDFTSHLSI